MKPKIDFQIAELIRKRYRQGVPGKILAYRYGLTKSSISYIVNNRSWTANEETQTGHGPRHGAAARAGDPQGVVGRLVRHAMRSSR